MTHNRSDGSTEWREKFNNTFSHYDTPVECKQLTESDIVLWLWKYNKLSFINEHSINT